MMVMKRQTTGQDMKLLDTDFTHMLISYVPARYELPKVTRRYETACTKTWYTHAEFRGANLIGIQRTVHRDVFL